MAEYNIGLPDFGRVIIYSVFLNKINNNRTYTLKTVSQNIYDEK